MSMARIPRKTREMVAALRRHTELLANFSSHAFDEGDDNYLGEVAGKLRLLVYESRTNKPLLLTLADDLGADTSFELSGPPGFDFGHGLVGGQRTSLREYLAGMAFFGTAKSGERVELSKMDVIALWSQQMGAAHEDEAIDPRLHYLMSTGVSIGGRSSEAQLLRSIANTVLAVALRVLKQIDG
jgi:hypothetical protein